VPLTPSILICRGSWVKVEIALARGKNTVDKRQDIKEKDMKRDLGRISKLQY
jgi:SsrA-binding protein